MILSIHFQEDNIEVILPDTARRVTTKAARNIFIFSTVQVFFANKGFIQNHRTSMEEKSAHP